MILRTCHGCAKEKVPCIDREAFKDALRGLGVTSVKWKCKSRVSAYEPGDPVWARTQAFYAGHGEDGCVDDFPATVIRVMGTKAVVFIAPGSLGAGGEYQFEANNNGFCKIPLSRLKKRDGMRESVCRYCQMPESQGHAEGYSCTMAASMKEYF